MGGNEMKYGYNHQTDKAARFFPLPNEIFALELSSGELLVYMYLMYCEDRETYQCHPSYATIGKYVGMSRNTVKKYVELLEQKRLITSEPTMIKRKDGTRMNGNLLFTILPIQGAVEYYYQQKMLDMKK